MAINLADTLDRVIRMLEVVSPWTPFTLDDKILELARIVQASPELIAWLQKILDARSEMPPGAQTIVAVEPKVNVIFTNAGVDVLNNANSAAAFQALIKLIEGWQGMTDADIDAAKAVGETPELREFAVQSIETAMRMPPGAAAFLGIPEPIVSILGQKGLSVGTITALLQLLQYLPQIMEFIKLITDALGKLPTT